jgi:hypothetical protein
MQEFSVLCSYMHECARKPGNGLYAKAPTEGISRQDAKGPKGLRKNWFRKVRPFPSVGALACNPFPTITAFPAFSTLPYPAPFPNASAI